MSETVSPEVVGDNLTVKVGTVFARFEQQARLRLKPSTREYYRRRFLTLAEAIGLEGKGMATLKGKATREAILTHLGQLPTRSRRTLNAAYQTVWTLGLGIPWPINGKYDMGKLPKTARRETPPDLQMKPWAEYAARERDAYNRAILLLLGQCGLRPSHLTNLKWRNIRLDANGAPFAIVADGDTEGFKTNAPVRARLPPDLARAILDLRAILPSSLPTDPLLPCRSEDGAFKMKAQQSRAIRARLQAVARREKLQHMPPVLWRHWVASACRRAGMPEAARAALQGHDPTEEGGMGAVYDNPGVEDLLELQGRFLPEGPMARLVPPTVALTLAGPPAQVAKLYEALKAGEIGETAFAQEVGKLARQESKANAEALRA